MEAYKFMESPTDPSHWDEATDVLVIGSGFAGLAAAIEAKKAGSSVVIIEKMKGYGGNSTISDGVMAAAGTPMQSSAGIHDSAELMYKDMIRAGLGLNHPELVRTVADNSYEALLWTIEYLGVKYKDRIDRFGGHSVPRCHTTHNRSGSAIIKQLLIKVKELGLRIRTRVFLQNILTDSDRSVCGVAVREGYTYPDETSGARKLIKVNKAIVLATGGFGNDINFRSSQDPRLTEAIGSTNKFSTTAESLKEAMRIGALPVHLSWIQLGPWACPDEKGYGIGPDFSGYIAFPYGIIVNPSTGRRIVNEMGDRKVRVDAILGVGQPCVALVDKKGVENSGYRVDHCLRKGVVKEFESTHDLAKYYNIPVQPFKDTVEQFNRYIEKGMDEEFGKPLYPNAKPINTPPYYSIRLWPKVHYTMGGVLINAKAQVLDLSRKPIRRLYAAGEVTGGVHGACRLGSCSITECLVFGRIAGLSAARH
jgi:flavocytochrome c